MGNSWKDYLLKSGLPLEYEVMSYLEGKKCIGGYEQSYIRKNELNTEKEFSYDINTSYIKDTDFVDLMIECKYRHESTKWIFTPESYNSYSNIQFASFLHPNDYFIDNKSGNFAYEFPIQFAPLASKGIEITSNGPNPKTIDQAFAQLSYGMMAQIISAVQTQLLNQSQNDLGNTTFYTVPIVVTTAELYRMKDNVSIELIRNSNDLSEIATNEDALIVRSSNGANLESYNKSKFYEFISIYGEDRLKKKLSGSGFDLDFLATTLSESHCPNSILVIHYSMASKALDKFFDYLERFLAPDHEIYKLIDNKQKLLNSQLEEFMQKLKKDS